MTSIVGRALADAHWITDDTVSQREHLHARRRAPTRRCSALVAANQAARRSEDAARRLEGRPAGLYPIDRSTNPPYLTGTAIGTDLTALRIGGIVFLSMPGEPFPEVRAAIAHATTGADTIIALSKGQDDWGYFYPGLGVGLHVALRQRPQHLQHRPAGRRPGDPRPGREPRTLGFPSTTAVAKPLPTRWEQALRPGVQAMANPTWGDAGDDGTLR